MKKLLSKISVLALATAMLIAMGVLEMQSQKETKIGYKIIETTSLTVSNKLPADEYVVIVKHNVNTDDKVIFENYMIGIIDKEGSMMCAILIDNECDGTVDGAFMVLNGQVNLEADDDDFPFTPFAPSIPVPVCEDAIADFNELKNIFSSGKLLTIHEVRQHIAAFINGTDAVL